MNRYVKFPEMWRITLNARPATAADWKLAFELLNRAKFSRIVRLTNHTTAKLGLTTRTRQRSLSRLGAWGLVSVKNRPNASPLVTVKWLAGRQPGGG